MANNKEYRVIKNIQPFSRDTLIYLRQDSSKVYRYFNGLSSIFSAENEEVLFYDFTKTEDDTLWVNYSENDTDVYIINYDYTGNFYGQPRRFQEYFFGSMPYFYYYRQIIVDSIGLVYRDSEVGTYYYLHGAIINGIQYGTVTDVRKKENNPKLFFLYQNYPNPFNPSTVIKYQISAESFVNLKIYDILGKEIVTLVNEVKTAGSYNIEFNVSDLASGVYIYTIRVSSQSGSFSSSKKMLVTK